LLSRQKGFFLGRRAGRDKLCPRRVQAKVILGKVAYLGNLREVSSKLGFFYDEEVI
jgi:hypothetical protein